MARRRGRGALSLGRAKSCHTVIACRRLSFLRDLHIYLAVVIAGTIICWRICWRICWHNDVTARGQSLSVGSTTAPEQADKAAVTFVATLAAEQRLDLVRVERPPQVSLAPHVCARAVAVSLSAASARPDHHPARRLAGGAIRVPAAAAPGAGAGGGRRGAGARGLLRALATGGRGAVPLHASEKDAKWAQKLGQLQPFIAVFPQE